VSDFIKFPGNCPKNVSKDAKYRVRTREGKIGVELQYEADETEKWCLTTHEHPDLIDMVTDVKTTHGTNGRGAFYINEYQHVLVPIAETGVYYYAGRYDKPLRFYFEGKCISGEPVDFNGNPMNLGDRWIGPHAGIPYILSANGNDIYYRTEPRPRVTKDILLSSKRGKTVAAQIARMLSVLKGPGGGRFYVNEFGAVFSPVTGEEGLNYVYFGKIDMNSWFPDPLEPQTAVTTPAPVAAS
jgi:hypothetical protein